jgi:glutaredoxin 3
MARDLHPPRGAGCGIGTPAHIREREGTSMPEITIYTTATCPYCRRAKDLLRRKNLEFTEISVDGDPQGRMRMMERADGRTSVPQIFFDDMHIGGCDDLYELDHGGKLDILLADLERQST